MKIQTTNSSYYLQYRTWNEGKTAFYPYVKSTVDDYAGVSDRPVQLLQIQALKSNGTQLDSGIVVMFRTYTEGKWLPWVSNADAQYMKNVQSQYNMDGTLDTVSGYAGISGKNIAGLEIRAFKGELDSGIQDLPGTESTPVMSWMYNNIWQSFPGSILHDPIEGLKIQTGTDKSYYLTYKTWNEGKTWFYPEVKSTENDYAGMAGRPIQRLNIKVFRNDGTFLDAGVVVMYRAIVDGKWMSWVSNATGDWMESVQKKYQLGGTLDTAGAYTGVAGKNIEGVEIRIFEENQIVDTPITPTGKHKIIQVDFFSQIPDYPTGCESVTAAMALHHAGINISVNNFINHYLDMQPYPFDPFETFGGDPRSGSGWGCYAPVIKKALDKALEFLPYYAVQHDGVTLEKLCSDYIDKDIPVILWATMGMRAARTISWSYNGKRIEWVQPEHCLLLVGYDEKHYIFNDSQKSGPLTYYTKESVETAYKAQFSQAVVILENPSDKEIAEIKKEKFCAILDILEVPSNNIDKGGFGLFREDNVEASVTEIVGNVKITYSCGKNENIHTSYTNNMEINVENGEINFTGSNDRSTITSNMLILSEKLAEAGMDGVDDPFIQFDALATEIGEGSISVGTTYKSDGTSVLVEMYYKVSLNVDITPNYSEEMYVVVKIEPIDKKPPEPPKEQFEYSPALTFEETLALIVATAGLILLLGPYAIAFVKSIGVRALAGAIL